ncbi:MAG: FHA domain-containing protein [Clostridia bacterium]|nr:FHA domain-containing protein [Clostridia bacterium]
MGHFLVFTSGSCAGFEVPLQDNQEVFIGKDPALCSVVIDKQYKTVSRKHVGVKYSPEYDMYVVVDYSTNGTFVVGGSQLARNEESYLNDGQSVNLGKTENTFRLETRDDGVQAAGVSDTVPFDGGTYDPYAQEPAQDAYYGDPMPMEEPMPQSGGLVAPNVLYPDGKYPGKGMAIAGMVLGIVSLVIPYVGLVTAIVGIVLSAVAYSKGKKAGIKIGMAIAGIVCSCVTLGFSILWIILLTGVVTTGLAAF